MLVEPTAAAVDVVARVREVRAGDLTVTLGSGCCDSTAPFLYEDFLVSPDDAAVGEVAGVAIYAPAWLRAQYAGQVLSLDALEDEAADSFSVETELGWRLCILGQVATCASPGVAPGTSPRVAPLGAEPTPGPAPERAQKPAREREAPHAPRTPPLPDVSVPAEFQHLLEERQRGARA